MVLEAFPVAAAKAVVHARRHRGGMHAIGDGQPFRVALKCDDSERRVYRTCFGDAPIRWCVDHRGEEFGE